MSSFDTLNGMIQKYGEKDVVKKEISGMNNVFQFIPEDGEPYFVSISQGKIEMKTGKNEKPTTTIKGTDEVLEQLMTGKLDPVMAFMSRKISVSGDIMSATKITGVMKKLKE
ncbi:SCP2 sterol-binding domain-containing protein [Caldiplasma sukawensis]